MKNINIKIKKSDLDKINKTSRRKEMVESGVYNLHKNKTFKSKGDYTRKTKHKEIYV